jgi:hypothetical protein
MASDLTGEDRPPAPRGLEVGPFVLPTVLQIDGPSHGATSHAPEHVSTGPCSGASVALPWVTL